MPATITTLGGRQVEGLYQLDTGAMGTLGMSTTFARDAGLPEPGQPTVRESGIAVGGLTEHVHFRIASLRVGDQLLHDLPINATISGGVMSYDGTLAGEVLSRFHVVLDYRHRRMGLTPCQPGPDRFPFDGAGLAGTMLPGGDALEVTTVHPDSAAALAGLRPGDRIAAIDNRPLADIGLAAAWRLFRAPTPATLTLLVHRDDGGHAIDIALRERI